MKSLTRLSALELSETIRNRVISVPEVTAAYLRAIEERDVRLHAYLSLDPEGALLRAAEIQKRVDAGELTGPLVGVPFAVKDNICLKGMPATCASKMLADYIAPYTATAVEKLLAAGAVALGKTNLDEFAMGSTTENSSFGLTRNPWNPAHVPGGSSGGSAAAVAAGEAAFALGTDTGGSVRQPAVHCGLVGLKPSYGSVSRYGLIAYASSLDQIGPLGRNIADVREIWRCMRGKDSKDATSVEYRDYKKYDVLKDISGLKIGVMVSELEKGISQEVQGAVRKVTDAFAAAGAQVEAFDFDLMDYAAPAYYILACAQASSNLARYDGVKYGYRTKGYADLDEMIRRSRSEGFGPEVQRRIGLGTFVLSEGYYEEYYLKARKVQEKIRREFVRLFARFDVLLMPVTTSTAPLMGAASRKRESVYEDDRFTCIVNLAGLPAVSVPCLVGREHLPVGVQFVGNAFEEEKVLAVAEAWEQMRGPWAGPWQEGES